MIKGHGDDTYRYSETIKMDFSSNICPHTDHSALMAHLSACGQDLLGHYPEPEAWSLEQMIAERLNIPARNVIVTNGATDAIYMIASTFRTRPVIPRPTFREYEDACKLHRSEHSKATTLWLCNPNNPTGEVYDEAFIRQACRRHSLVVVDQSYEHYTQDVIVPAQRESLRKWPNMIQLHSMTKDYAVPGLRLGYVTAPTTLVRMLRRQMRPWSVNAFAIEAGKFLLEHEETFRVRPDFAEVQRLWHALDAVPQLEVLPTKTTFMLCRLKAGRTAAELKDYLVRQHGILIRDASNFRGLTSHHFRLATQSPEENDALVAALRLFVEQNER